MPLSVGEVLEHRYKIEQKLGAGGFGAVYRAHDTRLDVDCAVKESFDSSEDAARQFKFGASMLANLRHPHLTRVTDSFDIPGRGLYLVMDYVKGEDLLAMINRLGQALPEDQVVLWLRQICDALVYLHSQNPPIIHRDIKPQNIIIDQYNKAILVDFGLAKLFMAGKHTSSGARGLTPGFAPLEQYGQGATDARSDIYSLGATAYTMLTMEVPPESIQRVISETLSSPRSINPRVSEPLSNAIVQAMEIDTRRRPQTAQAFLEKLTTQPKQAPREADERQQTVPLDLSMASEVSSDQRVTEKPQHSSSNGFIIIDGSLNIKRETAEPQKPAPVPPAGDVQRESVQPGLSAGNDYIIIDDSLSVKRETQEPQKPASAAPHDQREPVQPDPSERNDFIIIDGSLNIKQKTPEPQKPAPAEPASEGLRDQSEAVQPDLSAPDDFIIIGDSLSMKRETPQPQKPAPAEPISAADGVQDKPDAVEPVQPGPSAPHDFVMIEDGLSKKQETASPGPAAGAPPVAPDGSSGQPDVLEPQKPVSIKKFIAGKILGDKRKETDPRDVSAVKAVAAGKVPSEQPAAELSPKAALKLTLAAGVSMEFVRVPAGEFLMGSDPQKDKLARPDEKPQHRLRLDEYLIGKYPVTNRQYQAFLQASGHRQPGHWSRAGIPQGRQEHPVVNISWLDAVAFCEWASQVTGLAVRLPSEAEWEKAARGGDGRIFPWGDQAPDAKRCNFAQNVNGTTPVGKYSPAGDSPVGCADMAGNVWEWVADWHSTTYYQDSPASNPTGPETGGTRVLRGGAWNSSDSGPLRCAYRGRISARFIDENLGFRCARSR